MDERKLSINKVSSETKISRPAITAMYNNESKGAQFETLEKLINYFDLPLNELIGEKNEQTIFSFKNINLNQYKNKPSQDMLLVEKEGTNKELTTPGTFIFQGHLSSVKIDEKEFFFVVTPVTNNGLHSNDIVNFMIAFYGNDSSANLSYMDNFISELSEKSLSKLTNSILNSWYKTFKLLDATTVKKMPVLDDRLVLISYYTLTSHRPICTLLTKVETTFNSEKRFIISFTDDKKNSDYSKLTNKDFIVTETE